MAGEKKYNDLIPKCQLNRQLIGEPNHVADTEYRSASIIVMKNYYPSREE